MKLKNRALVIALSLNLGCVRPLQHQMPQSEQAVGTIGANTAGKTISQIVPYSPSFSPAFLDAANISTDPAALARWTERLGTMIPTEVRKRPLEASKVQFVSMAEAQKRCHSDGCYVPGRIVAAKNEAPFDAESARKQLGQTLTSATCVMDGALADKAVGNTLEPFFTWVHEQGHHLDGTFKGSKKEEMRDQMEAVAFEFYVAAKLLEIDRLLGILYLNELIDGSSFSHGFERKDIPEIIADILRYQKEVKNVEDPNARRTIYDSVLGLFGDYDGIYDMGSFLKMYLRVRSTSTGQLYNSIQESLPQLVQKATDMQEYLADATGCNVSGLQPRTHEIGGSNGRTYVRFYGSDTHTMIDFFDREVPKIWIERWPKKIVMQRDSQGIYLSVVDRSKPVRTEPSPGGGEQTWYTSQLATFRPGGVVEREWFTQEEVAEAVAFVHSVTLKLLEQAKDKPKEYTAVRAVYAKMFETPL